MNFNKILSLISFSFLLLIDNCNACTYDINNVYKHGMCFLVFDRYNNCLIKFEPEQDYNEISAKNLSQEVRNVVNNYINYESINVSGNNTVVFSKPVFNINKLKLLSLISDYKFNKNIELNFQFCGEIHLPRMKMSNINKLNINFYPGTKIYGMFDYKDLDKIYFNNQPIKDIKDSELIANLEFVTPGSKIQSNFWCNIF